MKKEKNGWGLAMMIFLMSILLAALIVIVIMVYNLYAYRDNPNSGIINNSKQVEYNR